MDIKNCVITIDAIGCQKQIAKQIIEQNGHYCLAVKANQQILHDEIREYFTYAEKEELEKSRRKQTFLRQQISRGFSGNTCYNGVIRALAEKKGTKP